MPKYEVSLYNSVSGNIHSVHNVEADDHAGAVRVAQAESDEQHGYTDAVRPAYRASVVETGPEDKVLNGDSDEEEE